MSRNTPEDPENVLFNFPRFVIERERLNYALNIVIGPRNFVEEVL